MRKEILKRKKRELRKKQGDSRKLVKVNMLQKFICDEREENNGSNFTCTICAKFCDISELSAKSVPEEHSARKVMSRMIF